MSTDLYSGMAENLSISEATEFLEGVLQLHSPMESLAKDRVSFLGDLIMAFLSAVPFQSVTAIAMPKPERRRLTFPEIKADVMTRQGGLCFELNYFMKVLLETLGYDVYHIACTIHGKPNNHLSTVVKNLSRPGDLHLVEVGCAEPAFQAFPLDFDKESPVYQASFLVHKFVRDADGSFRWLHQACQESDFLMDTDVDGWYTFMEFNLEFQNIDFFAPFMENVHTVEEGPEAITIFLTNLRAVNFCNGRLFAIKDTTILEEDASGKVSKKRLSSTQELLEAYKVHFPQFPFETVQQAMQQVTLNFQKK